MVSSQVWAEEPTKGNIDLVPRESVYQKHRLVLPVLPRELLHDGIVKQLQGRKRSVQLSSNHSKRLTCLHNDNSRHQLAFSQILVDDILVGALYPPHQDQGVLLQKTYMRATTLTHTHAHHTQKHALARTHSCTRARAHTHLFLGPLSPQQVARGQVRHAIAELTGQELAVRAWGRGARW